MQAIHVLLAETADPAARNRAVEAVHARAATWRLPCEGPRGAGQVGDRTLRLGPCAPEHGARWVQELQSIAGVEAVRQGPEAVFKVVDRTATRDRLHLEDARFGGGDTSIVAGPCAVESLDSLLPFAEELRRAGATALRAGAYKPRTSPYQFPGQGPEALAILAEVRRATGLAIVTELLDPRDAEAVAEVADLIQIGSRNMTNGALLRVAGASGRPVLLKRGMAATVSEFLQAAEYLADAGCDRILLCERGLRHFDGEIRNLLDLSVVPLLQSRTHLPVLVDPSHGTGRADLVPPMMLAAAAAGADGLLVEVHPDPPNSVSDAPQALDLQTFATTVAAVASVCDAAGRRLVTARTAVSAPSPSP